MDRKNASFGAAGFVLLLLLLTAAGASSVPSGPRPHAVVLVTLDTVRSDRLLGRTRLRLPSLEQAFATGARYANAVTSSPVTAPSHATILTGLSPVQHGLLVNGMRLDEGRHTLAEAMRSAGFQTAAFVSCSILRAGRGFEQGFDVYDDHSQLSYAPKLAPQETERSARDTTNEALRWLTGHEQRPFFLWVHYFDAHAPYEPPAAFRPSGFAGLTDHPPPGLRPTVERLAEIHLGQELLPDRVVAYYRDLYDGELRSIDAELGRLLANLLDSPYADELFLILTSDHGEELYEHDLFFEHNLSLHDTVMRVPLMLRGPGAPAGTIDRQVSNGSVFATVMDALALEASREMSYPSLLRSAGRQGGSHFMVKEPHPHLRPWGVALREPPWRYITWEDGAERLYHIRDDPQERRDLAEAHEGRTARMREKIREQVFERIDWDRFGHEQELAMDPETLAILRSLGYVR